MGKKSPGHIEQLPSGSWRVKVYGGTDPLTGREIRLRKTCKTERAAQIELGKLLEQAAAGRQPETNATVAELMDRYVEVADWDPSTRKANEFYIRRVIKLALGYLQLRKVRGPLLYLLYAQLRRCGDYACAGKPFTEHRNVPVLVDPASRQPAWQQVADAIRAAIGSGMLATGDPLSSVREMSALQDVPVATLQHALGVLADEGLIVVRQGRTATVAGEGGSERRLGRSPRGRDHDCALAGCKPHVCRPLTAKTIRNIRSILSGAFSTAERWEWIAWNPAESAKPPAVTRRPVPATSPEDVAKVIAEGRKTHRRWLCTYGWSQSPARGEASCAHCRSATSTWRTASSTSRTTTSWSTGAGSYVFSNDPMGASPWNPDWATHKASDLAAAAGVKLNIKGLRHYTASQLLAAQFDLRNTAARLGHGSGGATTLRHYADPVPEVDRRAAAYLAQLTAGSAAQSG